MPANLESIGLQAISVGLPALCQSFRITRALKKGPPLIDEDGLFVKFHTHDPIISFSLEGKGDFPTALAAGETDGGMTIDGISGGATLMLSESYSDANEDWDSWSAAGQNWPGATLVGVD